ncbi:MAG: hypothetical protein IPH41_13575 [Sulfuritalea sp.]|nr:hypothetical protein [Sulfuritalea sp.]
MSLPGDALPNAVAAVALQLPDDLGRPTLVVDYEIGGIALNDGTQGLQVQNWRARLVGNEIRVAPDPYTTETVLVTAAGITQLSIAFDQNMNPVVAYVQSGLTKLYWYSTALEAMTTTTFAADVRSPFLCMDDKRNAASLLNINDVLLFYVRTNRLCYRQQRDSYNTERTLAWFDGAAVTIKKAGMNYGLRMQVELVGMQARLATGAVLSSWVEAAYLASVTSITRAMPADILTGDFLYAALMHRSAVSPPAGWTLVTSVSCTETAITQTLSLFRKTTPAPADSGANATFTQASSGLMGLLYFAVRATTGMTLSYIGVTSTAVNDTATNAITAPQITAAATELVVTVATSVNATADVTYPSIAAGMSLISGSASQTRLGAAYQRRTVGQTSAGRYTFDNGTPANNGLAALTVRFGAA